MDRRRKNHVAAVRQKRGHTHVSAEPTSSAKSFGYVRVSREDQNPDMQIAMLRQAGVPAENIFMEKISAVNAKRPQFHLLLKVLEPGDTIVFYAFNRLYRNLKYFLGFIDDMKALGVKLRSLTEGSVDPFTTNGRMIASVLGAVDENERGRLSDRTRDGMAECKRQGMYLGRQPLFDDKQTAAIKRDRRTMTAKAVAKKWKCSAGTIDKYAKA